MRGNQPEPCHRLGNTRSIPACAGEPQTPVAERFAVGVYPRVCGGTCIRNSRVRPRQGLSPRVRGNPSDGGSDAGPAGSIPACAGDPWFTEECKSVSKVYPRVCGGPPPETAPPSGKIGSIPACAGEPNPGAERRCYQKVYPRVCGGTIPMLTDIPEGVGLSPRVRGNQVHRRRSVPRAGSIPACAGEPIYAGLTIFAVGVYPRVCGGT